MESKGRVNQRRRTRKDLLLAAARLLKEGSKPSMEEVADEALVSRATAYRYFSNVESLLCEAPLDGEVPSPEELFTGDTSPDPAKRVDRAEAALHEMVYQNETQLRALLSFSLKQRNQVDRQTEFPVRQNRRIDLIQAALAPARDRLEADVYEKLCGSLSLFFGIEPMVVFADVLQVNERKARKIKSWGIRALVRNALEESVGTLGSGSTD